jgi:hypothetical protein
MTVGSLDDLIRDLRRFEGRREVVKQLRKEIRKPLPAVRKAIRRRALDTLPAGGGLNVWVSKIGITAQIRVSGRSAGVKLRGGRNSSGGRSDIRAIDRGRVRHPSWGRRGRGQWHTQAVAASFFTEPATAAREWRQACVAAVDNATAMIRRG